MTNQKLKVALVGCGGMAARIRKRYVLLENSSLTLLVDKDEMVAKEASAELGGVPWSTQFTDVLNSDVDVVDISTPNHLHMPQAIASLEAGKHVLIQKPLAPTVSEAEAIVKSARKNGKKAGIYMSFYDNPLYHEAKEIIKSGLLGRIVSVRCRGAGIFNDKVIKDNWRGSVQKTGGGSFIQLTIHPVNMVQWLLEDAITTVSAFSQNRFSPELGGDDVTAAICRFKSGIFGSLESSYRSFQYVVSVYGTEGYLTITNNCEAELMLNAPFPGEYLKVGKENEPFRTAYDCFTTAEVFLDENPYNQHKTFLDSIAAGKEPPVPVEVGLRDLRIVEAVYQSAQTKRLVEI